jgi:hypothetical protein
MYFLGMCIHIAIYVLARIADDKITGTSFQFFEQLTENWLTESISSFDSYFDEPGCPNYQERLIRSNFSGIVQSCDCSTAYGYVVAKRCNYGKSSRQKRCTNMANSPEIKYHSWGGSTLCRQSSYISNYLDEVVVSKPDACPLNTINCGLSDSLGNYLCIKDSKECPINSFIIGRKTAGPNPTITTNQTTYNSQSREYTFTTSNYTYVFNEDSGFADYSNLSSYKLVLLNQQKAIFYNKSPYRLSSSSSYIPKIITHFTVSDDTPCYDEYYWSTYTREYILLKSVVRGTCSKYAIEDKEVPNPKNLNYVQYNTDAVLIDKESKNDFLDDNNITKFLLSLPLYTAPSNDVTTSLYANKYVGISESCRKLIKIEYDGNPGTTDLILSLKDFQTVIKDVDGYVYAANICSLIIMIIVIVFTFVLVVLLCADDSCKNKINVVFWVTYFYMGLWNLIICAVAAGKLKMVELKHINFLINNNCLDAQAHTIIEHNLNSYRNTLKLSQAAAIISAISFFIFPFAIYYMGIVSKENYMDEVNMESGMLDHECNEAPTASPSNVVIENFNNKDANAIN